MTPNQAQRLIKKIADIKRVLAAEKRKYGGYDDSWDLRYLPTRATFSSWAITKGE